MTWNIVKKVNNNDRPCAIFDKKYLPYVTKLILSDKLGREIVILENEANIDTFGIWKELPCEKRQNICGI